jgi:hypothetical protein
MCFVMVIVTTQVIRLKAEGSELSRKARIKPFKTFSVTLLSETLWLPLKAFSLQPIHNDKCFAALFTVLDPGFRRGDDRPNQRAHELVGSFRRKPESSQYAT